MSLMGIDVGTSGCKAAVFSVEGALLAAAYAEYDLERPAPGLAELDPVRVWGLVKGLIRQVAARAGEDPIQALAVSSMGEAVVPVSAQRQVLGPSLLNFDPRGEEFLAELGSKIQPERLYQLTGNTLGNQYSLTKLMWHKLHQPALYEQAASFLHWSGFISYMLGAEPAVDYSLANRSLLFDLDRRSWSAELAALSGLDLEKLPRPVPSGSVIGTVSSSVAAELGLPEGVIIAAGAHDQNCNAVGCGAIQEGQAAYGMGTYFCIAPVFRQRLAPALMLERGLNTEHHAASGRFISFIYNQGGALLKWYRYTFAGLEKSAAAAAGQDIYAELIREIPPGPSPVLVLPHFIPTGPPDFISDSSGVMIGLKLETRRGDILKGILEGCLYYLRECVETLPEAGIHIHDFRVTGGASKSDAWVQLSADIFGVPFTRSAQPESGALGAAILGGVGAGVFSSIEQGVSALVKLERTFEPDLSRRAGYSENYLRYRQIWPAMKEWRSRLI